MAKTQFNKPVKTVRTDNGTEFLCLKQYLNSNGIINQPSVVPGRVERKHRFLNLIMTWLFGRVGKEILFQSPREDRRSERFSRFSIALFFLVVALGLIGTYVE